MFGDDLFADLPAGSGSASISIDWSALASNHLHNIGGPAFSSIGGSASFQTISKDDSTSMDWAALSSFITISNNSELEGPSDDCYSWRKYGQKDILGAKYPRSYYKCTYRHLRSCWATKQVQRSDDDPTVFDITHKGMHTCNLSGSSNSIIVQCSKAGATENESTAAISIPFAAGGTSTAMGNGVMDKRNNIIVVEEPVTNGYDLIILEDTPAEAAEQDKQGFSMTVKATYMNDTAKFRWGTASWGIEELCRELEKRFEVEAGGFYIKYKDGDGDWIVLSCDEDLRFHVDTLKASKQSTLKLEICTRHQVEITSEKITQEISTGRQVELTFENITQFRGCTTQDDAAGKLGVSLSTLKRRCKELGFERWPNSKRKNGHCLPSSARVLKKTKGQCWNGDVLENEDAATKSVPHGGKCNPARDKSAAAMGNDEFGRQNDIIAVLATYEDDTVPFPLCCNSGIEQLRKELDDSFQIEGDKYKIKYKQEDGRWITLLRDTHLRFHIETLKAAGQSTMELSVFPDSL